MKIKSSVNCSKKELQQGHKKTKISMWQDQQTYSQAQMPEEEFSKKGEKSEKSKNGKKGY